MANPSFKKSNLKEEQTSENESDDNHSTSRYSINQMNAVIDEFKQTKTNLAVVDDIITDDTMDAPRSQFNEMSLLTRDPFFPSSLKLIEFPNKKSFLFGARPPLVSRNDTELRNLINSVDFTRITNRIILGGLFWNKPTTKKYRRNNIDDGSKFLKSRFKDSFMIWNLAGKLLFNFNLKKGSLSVNMISHILMTRL